ncbi:PREDICTED: UPF0725 protein At4g29550-like isoform X3 [Brassica oleracea var. oleracea]|uniref:UPF0725 protein At4g29550-like isoform X2 n=1 Tax=Brassica oleracea var. oleracea TaxID=109376 RepID=UPI0006A6E232|nr:PREDICTED: UPF0725 protein At4g29550-like isoform X2 [Brassica oleracea var. oleracea]XP_013616025.1 PREDICTED: UPF0725 protein At4g29550-like isoform X3 [Brassica oleracea var. oleracea]
MTSSSPKPNLCAKCQAEITDIGPPPRKRRIESTAAAPDDESSHSEFDDPVRSTDLHKFENSETGFFRDLANIYARFGLHSYNSRKGTNFQLSRVDKYINYGVFSYSLTFEATDPADGSCFTFQARVLRDDNVKGSYYRIMTEGCRIKPQIPGTREKIHRWEFDPEVYKDTLPDWYPDDALLLPSNDQFHQVGATCSFIFLPPLSFSFSLFVFIFALSQVQDSDILENDWLKLYADLAMYTLKEADMSLFESWLPLEISKVVVQTFEYVKSKEKLKAGNAIFYFSFKNLNAPPHGLCQDHRVIIRRTTDGLPGHACLDFKSCTGHNIFKASSV